MKRVWMAATVVAVTAMATAAWAQEEYVLQYGLPKPGEPVVMHSVTHIAGAMQGMGIGVQKMTQKIQQWIKLECLEVDSDGIAKVRMTFERMAMDMNFFGKSARFDSADPPSSQPGKDDASEAMRKGTGLMFAGKSLTATVTPEGKCLKLEGIDEMFEGMKDFPGGESMLQSLKESMSENVMSNQLLNTQWVPKKPVRIGETWSTEQRMKMGPIGEVTVKSRNKLLAVETIDGRRIARIGQTTNMEVASTPGGSKLPGMENVQIKMTSLGGTGTWLWDLDKGRMVGAQQNAPLEMSTEFGSATQPSASFKIGAKANYSTAIEIVGDPIAAGLLPPETPKAPASEPSRGVLEMAAPAAANQVQGQ